MRKKIIVGSVVLLSAIAVLLLSSGVDKSKLPGEIIFGSPYTGVEVYIPSTDRGDTLLYGPFHELALNPDKTKMLCMDNDFRTPENVVEYDFTTKKARNVEEFDDKRYNESEQRKYVPNSGSISYIQESSGDKFINRLVVFDLQTHKETVMADGVFWYDWNKDGSKVLIQGKGYDIYELDLKTGDKKRLFEGMYAVYSNSNQYIAYQNRDGYLIVHEVSSGQEWKRRTGRADNVAFSPDDNYLVYGIDNTGLVGNPYHYLYVYDFKNNRESRLWKDEGSSPGLAWR